MEVCSIFIITYVFFFFLFLGLVEFLGPRLSSEELGQIWALGDKSFHVVDNLHGVLAAAAPKLAPAQLDHLLQLVQEVTINIFYFIQSYSLLLYISNRSFTQFQPNKNVFWFVLRNG